MKREKLVVLPSPKVVRLTAEKEYKAIQELKFLVDTVHTHGILSRGIALDAIIQMASGANLEHLKAFVEYIYYGNAEFWKYFNRNEVLH